jgi:hypothetical protein
MGYELWCFGALMGPILGGVVYDTAGYYVSWIGVPYHYSGVMEC